jgi:molecular chaperone GrpE
MASDRDEKRGKRIPIRILDAEAKGDSSPDISPADMDRLDPENDPEVVPADIDEEPVTIELPEQAFQSGGPEGDEFEGGPATAELVATRAELRRVQAENADLRDRLARRQADFENYRKRMDRERSETYNRVVIDITAKLLPVVDNLKRALEAEASKEASESDEFRHFLSGVDLIFKQLNGVLEALGVTPIASVGEQFNPHVHEAVVTEATDEYEPDTVIQEIVSGYKLGDKLIRPALVKVAKGN